MGSLRTSRFFCGSNSWKDLVKLLIQPQELVLYTDDDLLVSTSPLLHGNKHKWLLLGRNQRLELGAVVLLHQTGLNLMLKEVSPHPTPITVT